MTSAMRSTLKLCSTSSLFRLNVPSKNSKQRLYSTLLNITRSKSIISETRTFKSTSSTFWSNYIISSNQFSTKSEAGNDLAAYLNQAIPAEEAIQQGEKLPSKIDGFQIELDGSNVSLVKSLPEETITVSFNVNHSVVEDTYESASEDNQPEPELVSRPRFKVDIQRGSSILGFSCSYDFDDDESMISNNEQEQEIEPQDIFVIEEIVTYKGELKDNDYRISTEILDATLYQILMDFLYEKGVSSEFMQKVSTFCTDYQYSLYVNFLKNLQEFEKNHKG